jgi:nucleotide-binding universal stress UspA family protein
MTENSALSHIRHAVVAGVDGSAASWSAIRAAAWEAVQRGQDLVLAHGYTEPLPYMAYGWSPYVPSVADVFEGPKAVLAETARKVRAEHPDLAVHTELLAGGGSAALVQHSGLASLIVVGSRGHGGFAGLSIGSVAAQTAAYATCPVLVIRAPGQSDDPTEEPAPIDPAAGPVLVAVSGSPHDEVALRFAFEEASLRQVPLVGVHIWWYPPEVILQPDNANPYDHAVLAEEAERVLAEAMAGWRTKYPDIPVEHRAIHALNVSYTLIEESARAGLVVVGCRGRGGFTGLVLGSVSRDLVGHADAPVAVIHDHA